MMELGWLVAPVEKTKKANKYFELTTSYVISNRRFEDSKNRNNQQKGNFLRIQAQLNF